MVFINVLLLQIIIQSNIITKIIYIYSKFIFKHFFNYMWKFHCKKIVLKFKFYYGLKF